MKKTLLSLFLSILSVSAVFSQQTTIEKTVLFDFTNPNKLTPQIPTSGYNLVDKNGNALYTLPITDYVFTEGPISLSFDTDAPINQPSMKSNLTPPFSETNPYWYVLLQRGTLMKVTADKVELLAIEICGDYNGNPQYSSGSLDIEESQGAYILGKWNNDGIDNITSVAFRNFNNQFAVIPQLKVVYRSPLDVLALPTVTPADNSEVNIEEFQGLTFAFDQNVTVNPAASFTVYDADGQPVTSLTATVSGSVVTLSPAEPITKSGTYTVISGKRAFTAADGTYTKEFQTTFTLKEAENTFAPETITPAPTTEAGTEVASTITLTFPKGVGFVSADRLKVYDSKGTEVRQIEAARVNSGQYNTVELKFANEMGAITEKGIYTITIPEKFIYDNNYTSSQPDFGVSNGARYNPEIVLTYSVGGAYKISEELKTTIETALSQTGLGYPKATAVERTALAALLQTAVTEEEGSDDELKNALLAYYNSADVEMPESDKYYTIANYGTDGKLTYLSYANGAVSTTSTASNAAGFKFVATTDDKYNMLTADGKYLHTLVTNNIYKGTSTANISETYDATFNDLTVSKLVVEGAEAKDIFGKFSIYGAIGTKGTSQTMNYAYSLFTGVEIDIDANGTPCFGDGSSSAFVFAQTTAPDPTVTYSVSPVSGTELEQLTSVTVTFDGITEINYNPAKTITLTGATQSNATGVTVNGNAAVIRVMATDNGTYTLNIPEGTFTYYNIDHNVDLPAITATYTVKSNDAYQYNLDINYKVYTKVLDEGYYAPELLNTFCLYMDETEPFINDQVNSVGLVNYDINSDETRGVLVKRSQVIGSEEIEYLYQNGNKLGKIVNYINNKTMVILDNGNKIYLDPSIEIKKETITNYRYFLDFKFDKTFDASNTKKARYGFVVMRGSYGDSIFGQYLSNSQTVKRSDCHLNEKAAYYFNIDPALTAIEDVTVDADSSAIYDLSGRRIQNISRPGIYIINGKKFIKK